MTEPLPNHPTHTERPSERGDIPELSLPRRLLVHLVHRLLLCVHRTIRLDIRCEPSSTITDTILDKQCILVMWHGEQLAVPFIVSHLRSRHPTPPVPLIPLVSKHADGRLIAYLLYLLGFRSIGGSSKKGGSEGLRRLIRAMKGGAIAAITVDGPRGPRHEVKEGAIKLAQITGAPLIGMVAIPHRCYRFNSWDRMFFPLPFSRITAHFLTPQFVSPDDDPITACARLRQAMLRYHQDEDR